MGFCGGDNDEAPEEVIERVRGHIAPDRKVRHVSGAWPCGCDDEIGTVSKVGVVDGEPMAFVGTPCFWQWFDVRELLPVTFVTAMCRRGEHGECLSFICGCDCHD